MANNFFSSTRGKHLFELADCVSVPADFFGKDFEKLLIDAGETKIIGRVIEVEEYGNLSVQWDCDNTVQQHVAKSKLTREPTDTPKQSLPNYLQPTGKAVQSPTSVILAEDIPSNISSEDFHVDSLPALGENSERIEEQEVVLATRDKVSLFKAKVVPFSEGDTVHHRKIAPGEGKFLITNVLEAAFDWQDFDEDIHQRNSFIKWNTDLTQSVTPGNVSESNEKKPKFQLRIKGRKMSERIAQQTPPDIVTSSEEEDSDIEYLEALNSNKKNVSRKRKVEKKVSKKKKIPIKARKTVVKTSNGKTWKNAVSTENLKNNEDSEDSVEEDSGSAGETENEEDQRNQGDTWRKGGWTMNPNERQPFGPKLNLPDYGLKDELSYFMRFLPMDYIHNELLVALNKHGRQESGNFNDVSLSEFMVFLGLTYSMEIVKLPERDLYWTELKSDIFPSMKYGKYMARDRYKEIVRYLQFSTNPEKHQQIPEFLSAVNLNLREAVTAGDVITLDESMIKSFHKNLKGKIKIKRKPRPVGNEIKDLSDGRSNIVLNMELYEGKEEMQLKEHVHKYGATCATTLRLTAPYYGTGRVVLADSWFGSVKTAIALKERGLFSVLLVKTAHKR